MNLRKKNIDKLIKEPLDVLIIGGGINGATSAAALSSRKVKTGLIDQGDFASFTSQNSSNLIWGGIKYLENYDFLLVRKLCKSRNQLIKNYPTAVKEIRFFMSVAKNTKHNIFILYAASWLYWILGNCHTKIPEKHNKKSIKNIYPAIDLKDIAGSIEYSDAFFA